MTNDQTLKQVIKSSVVKRAGFLVGAAAVLALAASGVVYGAETSGPPASLAGSGDAPTNTTYTQPGVTGMNVGATATMTTPGPTLATSMAVPALKAGS